MDIQTSNFLKILKNNFDDEQEVLLEEPVDWEFMSELARKQNLLPLFFEAASRMEAYTNSSGYIIDQLDTFSMVAAQVQRSNAFVEIYEKIAAQGIYPIVMKGIVCRQLYGELGEHRPSSDEDILVEVKDFYKVKEILEREEYICSYPEITTKELAQIQEVSFFNPKQMLTLEVHTNIIGKENEERAQMNCLFQKVHEQGEFIPVCGINIKTLEATENQLFLILHAYKHFKNRGVGIRQVMDILLYYKENKHRISMEQLQRAICMCKAENFWADLLYIGNKYLGFANILPENTCCPEELLQDMLYAGVFGGQEKTDYVAANVQLSMKEKQDKQSKLYMLFCAAFPTKEALTAGYPYLEERPWQLPVVWVKRWIKFTTYAKKDVWKVGKEILQKSSTRMEIIKKYKK